MYLPLFPLELVVFPGQKLPLYIFEPRYKQLIAECRDSGIPFGIPTAMDGRVSEYGTEMELVEVLRTRDSGEMDIVTRGMGVFHIESFQKDVPDKLYSGAEVIRLNDDPEGGADIKEKIVAVLAEIGEVLEAAVQMDENCETSFSFEIGHKVGMSLSQKVTLLSIPRETDRLRYILDHMEKCKPLIEELRMGRKAGGNGNAKHFN